MDLVDESTTCCYSPKLPENTYQRVQPSLETLVEFLHGTLLSVPRAVWIDMGIGANLTLSFHRI